MHTLSLEQRNAVLAEVSSNLSAMTSEILAANQKDLAAWTGDDTAMYDRLIADEAKIIGMIHSVEQVASEEDPIGVIRDTYDHPDGMRIENRTAPFGRVMIIYESRPDVTIEAASVAFKSNNKIVLKGGKEARHTNKVLVRAWHKALRSHKLSEEWVQSVELSREKTQAFLSAPPVKIDLIIPRGGEGLISYVKRHATCPVLVSGRGNNFLYVHKGADWQMALAIILNAKTQKISACNALDKVLLDEHLPQLAEKTSQLVDILHTKGVTIQLDPSLMTQELSLVAAEMTHGDWAEEYLSMKIAIAQVEDAAEAVQLINEHSGGHSAAIITQDNMAAGQFMAAVDTAAVYHNASTRYTDGGQYGMGAELAISTDKLHHRGPLGLAQLVTNKWYVYGSGQTR